MVLSSAATAAAEPDTTFRGDGTVVTDVVHRSPESAYGLVVQPDGRIVVAGFAAPVGKDGGFALVRYNADGTRDHSFGGDGIVLTNITGGRDNAEAVVRQANGKLIAVGFTTEKRSFALARYKPDGTLDRSYGSSGKVLTNFTPGSWDGAFAAALQPDGKLVAAGWAGGNGGRFAIARYLKNGSLDPSFGVGGKVMVNFTKGADLAEDVLVDDAGRIVVVGIAGGSSATAAITRFAVVRLNIDGARDESFGGDGRVLTDFPPEDSWAAAAALQADGSIVAVGTAGSHGAAVRYEADGSPDPTFGTGGKETYIFDAAQKVQLDGTGLLLLVGPNRLARLDDHGAVDPAFDAAAGKLLSFGNRFFHGSDLEIQTDGKIVVVGTLGGTKRFAVTRRLP